MKKKGKLYRKVFNLIYNVEKEKKKLQTSYPTAATAIIYSTTTHKKIKKILV